VRETGCGTRPDALGARHLTRASAEVRLTAAFACMLLAGSVGCKKVEASGWAPLGMRRPGERAAASNQGKRTSLISWLRFAASSSLSQSW
jgi:hypothetical protein